MKRTSLAPFLITNGIALIVLLVMILLARMYVFGPEEAAEDMVQGTDTDTEHMAEPVEDVPTELHADQTATPSPAEPTGETEQENLQRAGGRFELPISGASGWAARTLPLYERPETNAAVLYTLEAGQGFVILGEVGTWWYVRLDADLSGWVEHGACFINLPDILPSIVYNISNAGASMMRSVGYIIPAISSQKLYDAWAYSPRLDRFEFVVPTLYAMSDNIASIQKLALGNGDTLIMHEAFRPRKTQQKIAANLTYLSFINTEVGRAINTSPWTISSFIATSLSNHQRGAAMDVSLAKIISQETFMTGDHAYTHITEYAEYAMPSAMHELSPASAAYRMGDYPGALRLRAYCVDGVGLSPIGSEWWHYNDLSAVRMANTHGINGEFSITTLHSTVPNAADDEYSVIIFSDGLPHIADPPILPEIAPKAPLNEAEAAYVESLMTHMGLPEQIRALFIVDYELRAEGNNAYAILGGVGHADSSAPLSRHDLGDANGDFYPFSILVGEQVDFCFIGHGDGGSASQALPDEQDPAANDAPDTAESEPIFRTVPMSWNYTANYLRAALGFGGIIVSTPMSKAAITEQYSAGEAAIMAIEAGCDMILLPADMEAAHAVLIQAVEAGTISHERIHDSLRRILGAKLALGLLQMEMETEGETDGGEE